MKRLEKRLEYPLISEQTYCAHPADCLHCDLLIIGSGIGTAAANHAVRLAAISGARTPNIVVLESGPFDIPCHLGDLPGYVRRPYICSPSRLGGKLTTWGVSSPRPRQRILSEYPYDHNDLLARFASVECELGVPDQIPMSGRNLELRLLSQLRDALPDASVNIAPLAINRLGKRWTPLKHVPDLVAKGVQFVSRCSVSKLHAREGRVTSVTAQWIDGENYEFRPNHVFVATGLQPSLPLLQPILHSSIPLRTSDHHRIDCHGWLKPRSLGDSSTDELGVAVLIVEAEDNEDDTWTPFHVEVKVAPLKHWREGFMQSSDNLSGEHSDDTVYTQLQVVSAMKDRLPLTNDILNTGCSLRPVMTARDAKFHGRLVSALMSVAEAVGLPQPSVAFRELTTNHHLYRAFSVSETVNDRFRSFQYGNLSILPPTAFLAGHECDANPTLKSLILSQYAVEDVIPETHAQSSKRTVHELAEHV